MSCVPASHGKTFPWNGLRQRHDLLAPVARLAGRRRLASPASGPAGRIAASRQAGPEPSQPGRGQCGLPPGGAYTGPNPTDRGKRGSKRHLIVDRNGVPLVFCVTGANRHDSVVLEELVDALPPIAGKPGRPRRWPGKLHADKAYDIDRCRHHLKERGITPRIARKGIERNDRLGRHRWVVERTHAWFAGMGKLRIRFERRIDIHLAWLSIACSIICLRILPEFC